MYIVAISTVMMLIIGWIYVLDAGSTSNDCNYNDVLYLNGQSFKQDCNLCTCEDGHVECKETTCFSIDCNYKGRLYLDGQIFTEEDCNTCLCSDGHVECTGKSC